MAKEAQKGVGIAPLPSSDLNRLASLRRQTTLNTSKDSHGPGDIKKLMSANHLPKKQKSNMNVLGGKSKAKDEKPRATSPSDKSEKEDKVPMTADKRGDDQKILRDSQDVSIMVGS